MAIDLNNIRSKVENDFNKKSSFFDFLNKDIKLFNKSFNDKKKEKFYSELSILLSSGIDIKTSLEIIIEEQQKEKEKEIFKNIFDYVINGDSLSAALEKTGKFSQYEYFSIKIGEESGRLNDVLIDITKFYVKKIKQKRQMVNAFTYPGIVLFTAFAAVFFMLKFMVPMFVEVFSRFHGKLPFITQVIINTSDVFSKYIGWMFLFLILMIIILYQNRKKERFRYWFSKILLSIPIIGEMVKMMYLERFFQSMTLLMSSKTPMLKAIQLVRKMIGFYPFERALEKIESDIMYGIQLNESMKQFKFFDKRVTSLIKVAEEVNQLETIFDKLNKQYSEEMDHKLSMISSLLEPIMIIFVGLLVGIILISMYLPMFQLSTSIY